MANTDSLSTNRPPPPTEWMYIPYLAGICKEMAVLSRGTMFMRNIDARHLLRNGQIKVSGAVNPYPRHQITSESQIKSIYRDTLIVF